MECVLDVLRGETNRRDVPCDEWLGAFRVAEQERIRPFFAARLRESGATFPDPILDEILRAKKDAARNSFWWTSELRGILQAFAAKAIPVIPLKGPMLAESIYGSIELRVSRDLDLLVHPSDIDAAASVLVKLGFASHSRPNKFHCEWRRGTSLVELHFDAANQMEFKFDTAGAWERAQSREFLGQPVLQFEPSDELLFLCLHGVRHRFECLCHVLDIALALKRLTPEIDPKVYERGLAARLLPLIVLGRAMAMRLNPHGDPGPEIPVRASTAEHLGKLADRLWTEKLERPAPLINGLTEQIFYLEIETTTRDRLMRLAGAIIILATRLTRADFDFAGQFGVRQAGLIWVLRQFRLAARLFGLNLASAGSNRIPPKCDSHAK
jgi:hypothetical protein